MCVLRARPFSTTTTFPRRPQQSREIKLIYFFQSAQGCHPEISSMRLVLARFQRTELALPIIREEGFVDVQRTRKKHKPVIVLFLKHLSAAVKRTYQVHSLQSSYNNARIAREKTNKREVCKTVLITSSLLAISLLFFVCLLF